ncbi:hypothetical protein KJ359_006211 [Pestalotiopsis sp. 9143b]|nr:hypothetical protein KJ359_006211 [Pestalotiopsis sp. 9143b]
MDLPLKDDFFARMMNLRDSNLPAETPDPNSGPDHATPVEQEQTGDKSDHIQPQQNYLPVQTDEDISAQATTSDPHQMDAPAPPSDPVVTPNETQSQETPSDDEDSMFVPENFYDNHSIHEDEFNSNEGVDNVDAYSQSQDGIPLAGEGASDIPAHNNPHNGDTTSQEYDEFEPGIQQGSYNADHAYGPPQPQGSQAYATPSVYQCSKQEAQLLEAEYQTVLKSIAALKARKSVLEDQPITNEANTEMAGIDQEMMSLRTRVAQLTESFQALGISVPFLNPNQPAKFTGLRKGQTVHSSEEYWTRRNKNNEKDISKKRKILEQETISDDKRTIKKPKMKPRIFDRMQDGSDLAKKGATHSLGKLRFDNPTQARMVRDSVAGALENEPEDEEAESRKTFLETMHPEVFNPDQTTLFKCAASFGEGNCVKLADGNYRIRGCTEPVRPHQMCGASWMNEKEFSQNKGGIVANEQGTGKTYQAIINMLTHPPSREALDEGRKSTLIIVPSNVLQQWQMELARFTTTPSFAAYKEGSGKLDNSRTWKALDVIFVSHDQFRRAYFSTAALKQYEDKECDEDTKAQLRLDHLGFLFQNKWWRVIIDEAHAIKNYDTKLFKACQLWAYLVFLDVSWRGSHKNFMKLLDNLHLV